MLHSFLVLLCTLPYALASPCSGRIMLNQTHGTIKSNAGSSYAGNIHCEWLIVVQKSGQYIRLQVQTPFHTECMYDMVYVYDGSSHSDKLLAVFSGHMDLSPPSILASSGKMLVHFFSDRNYVQSGFTLTYTIEDCPFMCNGRGACIHNQCQCLSDYWGLSCNRQSCAKNCGQYGICVTEGGQPATCVCNSGFFGSDCSLSDKSPVRESTWHMISESYPARSSSDGSYVYNMHSLVTFGGYGFEGSLNHVTIFNFSSNSWKKLKGFGQRLPEARFGHRFVFNMKDMFLLYGGMGHGDRVLDDAWTYNVTSSVWTKLHIVGSMPALAYHTMTYVASLKVYIVYGGMNNNGNVLSDLYELHYSEPNGLITKKCITNGVPAQKRSLYGHTAVYDSKTESLLVFGGFLQLSTGTRKVNHLLQYVLQSKYWMALWPMDGILFAPTGRAFHTSVVLGDFMIIFGGAVYEHYSITGSHRQSCYDNQIFFFNLRCKTWVNPALVLPDTVTGSVRGRYSHGAFPMGDNFMLLQGGFAGQLLYTLSVIVFKQQSLKFTDTQYMAKNGNCPGQCGLADTCRSCVAGHNCIWCSADEKCVADQTNCADVKQPVWYSSTLQFARNASGCIKDTPHFGVTLASFVHPPNYSHPDDLRHLPELNINSRMHILKEAIQMKAAELRIHGYLHVPVSTQMQALATSLFITGKGMSFRVFLSQDHSTSNLDQVAWLRYGFYDREKLSRKSPNRPLFSHDNRARYYFRIVITPSVVTSLYIEHPFSMQLLWNDTQVVSGSQLEAHVSGSNCFPYDNCFACLGDASCIWLLRSSVPCINRANISALIQKDTAIISELEHCPACNQLTSCAQCTSLKCHWSSRFNCIRPGRLSKDVLTQTKQCPPPCFTHTSCHTCVESSGCLWCYTTSQCAPLSLWPAHFPFGQCADWIDNGTDVLPDHASMCVSCARLKTCKACIHQFTCGWCTFNGNYVSGVCVQGDFSGPLRNKTCQDFLYRSSFGAVSGPLTATKTDYFYTSCPDIDECALGIHDCHQHAMCFNTKTGYTCKCKRGYVGGGHQNCTKTCYEDCGPHGACSGAPKYACKCELGWTSSLCNVSCGCYGHSTCRSGVGSCDRCQHGTAGPSCELCKAGYYGDATSGQGCVQCQCNGHEQQGLGVCNHVNGTCFCEYPYHGVHCELCQPGFSGDPKEGRLCYSECSDRKFLLGINSTGGIVSQLASDCIWIITSLNTVSLVSKPNGRGFHQNIAFEIEHISTTCGVTFVMVYDGLPPIVQGSVDPALHWRRLASYCGSEAKTLPVVQSTASILTVIFRSDSRDVTSLFKAKYFVLPHQAKGGAVAICSKTNCVCPNNCSLLDTSGLCNETGLCSCRSGHNSPACSRQQLVKSEILNAPAVNPRLFNRMGHTLTPCDDGYLYLFGGQSLESGVLDDFWKFKVLEKVWEEVQINGNLKPQGRYYHAAVCVQSGGKLFIHGGFLAGGVGPLPPLWSFDLIAGQWSLVPVAGSIQPPPLAGHSMLHLPSTGHLILFAGASQELHLNKATYIFDLDSSIWSKGEQALFAGLFGQSAVHHSSGTIFVFGGYEHLSASRQKASPRVHVYKVGYGWSLLPDRTGSAENSVSQFGRYFQSTVNIYGDEALLMMQGVHIVPNPLSSLSPATEFVKSITLFSYMCNTRVTIPLASGLSLPPRLGGSTVLVNNSLFTLGGFHGNMLSEMARIELPSDICTLFHPEENCEMVGFCRNATDTCIADSTKSCKGAKPLPCDKRRDCDNCLSVDSTAGTSESSCAFCYGCRVSNDRCIVAHQPCPPCLSQAIFKSLTGRTKTHPGSEPKRLRTMNECYLGASCHYSTCDQCLTDESCAWTQYYHARVHTWDCLSYARVRQIQAEDGRTKIETVIRGGLRSTSRVSVCPRRCYQHIGCSECLSATSHAEAMDSSCLWSELLQQCLAPGYVPLRCSTGECDHLVSNLEECPVQRCSSKFVSHCSQCLSSVGCAWCALTDENGVGICMQGGLFGPKVGSCKTKNISSESMNPSLVKVIRTWYIKDMEPSWNYRTCPYENECINGHHNCGENEICLKKPGEFGFSCVCRPGFKFSQFRCWPVCNQGCVHGTCTEPDVCTCHFGFTSPNCTVACKCNGHSDCQDAQHTDVCLACQNNTQGSQCQECKPFHVGEPSGVTPTACQPCWSFCNNHTDYCVPKDQYNQSLSVHRSAMFQERGSLTGDTVCVRCHNGTEGQTCSQCKRGFFRIGDRLDRDCNECMCHGHGTYCSPGSGENCNCQNNTATNCGDGQPEPCWKKQCTVCKEEFLGKPLEGKQCYRLMHVDRDYCLDPEGQTSCINPTPLGHGQTVLFFVRPKYVNVNLRIYVHIAVGAADVYFSSNMSAFSVLPDSLFWHKVDIDSWLLDAAGSHRWLPMSSFRTKRSPLTNLSQNNTGTQPHSAEPVTGHFLNAEPLESYVTVTKPNTFVVVRGVRFRLVISMPQKLHSLKEEKFFMVIQGSAASYTQSNVTFGYLFFRQDQPHIDLFVFFSVFFSFFFLSCSACVMFWKIKNAFDQHRMRHQRAIELEHLAARPFGSVLLEVNPPSVQGAAASTKTAKSTQHGSTSKPSTSRLNLGSLIRASTDAFTNVGRLSSFSHNTGVSAACHPIAVEPLQSGNAAVATTLLRLPGGNTAHQQICLGSTLASLRDLMPHGPPPPRRPRYQQRVVVTSSFSSFGSVEL